MMKPSRSWFRFSVRAMFVVLTILGVWLGRQVQWMRDRHEARMWIIEHETDAHAARDGLDDDYWTTSLVNGVPVTTHRKWPNAPWSIRILGEERLPCIHLDKSKLSESDITRIDSLQILFPEVNGVHVEEPGWCSRWPPKDRAAFIKYPTQWVDGKLVNRPLDESGSD